MQGDVFAEAYHERRHWLVTFKRDEPHVPHKAVCRVVLKASAAAILDYFKSFQDELGMKQEDIENRIAEAMETGGFRSPTAPRSTPQWTHCSRLA